MTTAAEMLTCDGIVGDRGRRLLLLSVRPEFAPGDQATVTIRRERDGSLWIGAESEEQPRGLGRIELAPAVERDLLRRIGPVES